MERRCFRGIFLALTVLLGTAQAIEINEIRIDQPVDDIDEYFELVGGPGESLDGYSYLVIGDGPGGSGIIESLISLDGLSIPDDGFFLAGEETFSLHSGFPDLIVPLNFENGDNVTHLLVTDFSNLFALGDDLDTTEDGMLDVLPWGSVVDAVGLVNSRDLSAGKNDFFYGEALGFVDIGPAPDGFVPAHIFRASDAGSSWVMGMFDPLESEDTPGSSNTGQIVEMPVCDFDLDGDCDPLDADRLTAVGDLVAGVSSGFDPMFDLTNDNQVNGDDLTEWLKIAGDEHALAGPLLRGDANLDGTVNASDLNVVGIHWLQNAEWSGGDFNGDGMVNANDLNFVGIHWLSSVPAAGSVNAAVPEPSGLALLLPWLAFVAAAGRARS